MLDSAISVVIDRTTPVPLHDQISEGIRGAIVAGRWPEHYKLPAEPDLAREIGVSRGTVRRALQTLISEGLLQQVHGRGTFVSPQAIEQNIADRFVSLAEDLTLQQVPFRTAVLGVELVPAPEAVQETLHVGSGGDAVRIRRVRSDPGGRPLMYLVNWLHARHLGRLRAADLARDSLFDVIEHDLNVRIAYGRRTFEPQAATAEVADCLQVALATPVLRMEQISYTDAASPAVEFSLVWTPPETVKISSVIRRR